MCQSVPSYQLLPRGTYRPMITSLGASKYHALTTRTTSGLPSTQNYRGNHISTKCRTQVSKTIGLLKRTLRAAPQQVRQTAYEVLVRPMLEFATCAWTPHTKTGIQTIERIQRSSARFLIGDYRRTSCVSDMCTNLMWNSLYTRRRIRDATMFFFYSPRTNAHQLACHNHHSRCAHQTPTQAQTTNPTSRSY